MNQSYHLEYYRACCNNPLFPSYRIVRPMHANLAGRSRNLYDMAAQTHMCTHTQLKLEIHSLTLLGCSFKLSAFGMHAERWLASSIQGTLAFKGETRMLSDCCLFFLRMTLGIYVPGYRYHKVASHGQCLVATGKAVSLCALLVAQSGRGRMGNAYFQFSQVVA